MGAMLDVRFSVVVPLYNKAPHIVRTLQSVLGQCFPALEILVVNDGSTDEGPELVMELDDARIKMIHQTNGGVACARNTGIDHAQCNWIAFLDADDWLHPDYLQALAKLIVAHPQCDMVGTQYKSISYDQTAYIQPWPVDASNARAEIIHDLPSRWMRGTSFFTSSVAVRTSRLRSMQPCFPPGETFGEDLDLWFRLAETTAIALNPTPLVARIWVADSLSVMHLASTEPPFLLRMADRAKGQSLTAAQRLSTQRFVDHSRITLARSAIIAGDRALAQQLLWRAKRTMFSRRWWLSALMATLLPGPLVHRWQHWRKRRKMVLG
jgi:glycosyltransferase involved in cell wall biosynthesis